MEIEITISSKNNYFLYFIDDLEEKKFENLNGIP